MGLASIGGKRLGRMTQYSYEVNDANCNIALEVRKGNGPSRTQFTVVEPEENRNFGIISLK